MDNEKVKEIKKALECCVCSYFRICKKCPYGDLENCKHDQMLRDTLDLINELESENERLRDENRILLDKDSLLEMVGLLSREKDILLKRIAELEEGIAKSMLGCEFLPECTNEKLKQFAEMLKEKMGVREYMGVKYKQGVFSENDINETLKEVLGEE